MTCVQVRPTDGRYQYTTQQSYTTEAECLQACKAGACCEGTTCTVKPQCQCQGTGKTFRGVGTTCSPNPCLYVCGACNSIPQSLTATVSVVGGGDYLDAMQCVAGNSSLTLSRPNVLLSPAPQGCWNSSTSVCDTFVRSEMWTSGIGNGGLMFRVIGQCVSSGVGARTMAQMYAMCSGSQVVFGFSCGRFRRTSSGCPDAYDFIGNPVPFSDVYDTVQIGLTTSSCSPFVATGTTTVNGVALAVTLSGNPLP
jgi:hypothetical protein